MKLRLVRKPQTGAGVEGPQRSPLELAHLRQPRALRSLQFVIEYVGRFTRRHKQITRQPFEIALYLLMGHNGRDALDSCAMAFGRQPRALLAVYTLQVVIASVERGNQVSRGP